MCAQWTVCWGHVDVEHSAICDCIDNIHHESLEVWTQRTGVQRGREPPCLPVYEGPTEVSRFPQQPRVDQWLCCSTWSHRRLRYCLLCCLRSLTTNFSLTDPHCGVSLLAEIKHGPQGVITFRAHRMAQARRTHAMYRTPELFVHALKHEILPWWPVRCNFFLEPCDDVYSVLIIFLRGASISTQTVKQEESQAESTRNNNKHPTMCRAPCSATHSQDHGHATRDRSTYLNHSQDHGSSCLVHVATTTTQQRPSERERPLILSTRESAHPQAQKKERTRVLHLNESTSSHRFLNVLFFSLVRVL